MILPVLMKDFYKADHRRQYPEGTEYVYSNLTARYSRLPGIDYVVVFGIQYFIKEYLQRRFTEDFFKQKKDTVLKQYQRRMNTSLGPNQIGVNHIAALHDLGYLPIRIKALPEGTRCPIRTPMLTIINTDPKFFWITNFLETLLSNVLWHPMTSATIAHEYRRILDRYSIETSDMPEFAQWQGHDFSMRGQTSFESAMVSSAAHLTSFTGTDTIPAIDWLEQFYNADSEKEMIGGSVPATEHSVMCMGGQDDEQKTYERLITEVYPDGIVSIVSDTWDYWNVLDSTIRKLAPQIKKRNGKIVIRPDSGDPEKIICGDPSAPVGSPAWKGTAELLWEIFEGTINSKGFRQLDPHIGMIYGDSITLPRCVAICENLKNKGFSSTNMVFGIGSYTYQYVTRDTFGFAMKATWGQINGSPTILFKSPKTDVGIKYSARGLLRVNEDLTLSEQVNPQEECSGGLLETVFLNGNLIKEQTLAQIRKRLNSYLDETIIPKGGSEG
jgi:nicotinamide phosphoribosyltransferase